MATSNWNPPFRSANYPPMVASLGPVPSPSTTATGALVVFGASGHAKVVIEVLRSRGEEPAMCVETRRSHDSCLGVPVSEEEAFFAGLSNPRDWSFFVGVGANAARARLTSSVAGRGLRSLAALSLHSHISGTASIGTGSLVMPFACINADARIGSGTIINTGAVVEHDCVVGDFAHVGPNATLGGWVEIGEQAFVGIGATVLPNVRIGAGAMVGAGSVVTRDVPEGATVVGNPARAVSRA